MTRDAQAEDAGVKMPSEAVSRIIAQSGARAVNAAIRNAGEATGVNFDLLYNMARRESALDPSAKASTSSAAGLFQFIEQTWLGAVKAYGARHGLAAEAAAISVGPAGKFTVADQAAGKAILDLRFNPDKASALAGELVRENQKSLEAALGRAATAAEIYAAHFLGPAGAARLLRADPSASAAALAPRAAAANRAVFYDGARARSVAEVVASFEKSMSAPVRNARAEAPDGLETKSAAPWTLLSPSVAPGSSERLGPREAAAQAEAAKRSFVSLFALQQEADRPRLAPLAIAILQALDPARIGQARERALRD